MSSKTEIIERVTKLARENGLTLPPDHSSDAGGADRVLDSIALLELIVAVEQEFDCSLMDEELDAAERLKDMNALAELILEKL